LKCPVDCPNLDHYIPNKNQATQNPAQVCVQNFVPETFCLGDAKNPKGREQFYKPFFFFGLVLV
jgi:hypothetical protein